MAKARMASTDRSPANDDDAPTQSALRTLGLEADGISALAQAMRNGLGAAFTKAVDLIRDGHGRVIVSGMGKSGHIGRKIAATLASTGTPSFYVHPAEASHGDLGMIANEDVVLLLSWSGETAELKSIIDYSRRFGIGLIAITAKPDSALGRAADVVLALPESREACPHNLAPTTSTTMQLAMGDALAIALLESRGFTAVDFGVLHPAGRLGAMLKFVRDLMHVQSEVPVVTVGTCMADAVVEMSAKGFGCVAIVDAHGKLAGIITDGDLRRHMGPGLLDALVENVMTGNPKTIRPDQLATEALGMMSSKIAVLIVAEAGTPVGIIKLHDLLRAGVA